MSRRSQYFNLAQLDAVPEREFNEVLWKAIKGLNSEMPAPVRAAFVKMGEKDGGDDLKKCNYEDSNFNFNSAGIMF